jgi:hypothetical protein
VFDEPFGYADGPLVGTDGSTWVSHGGAESEVDVVDGRVEITSSGGETEDVNAPLVNGPFKHEGGDVLYASFEIEFLSRPGTSGNYFAHFMQSGSQSQRGRIFAVKDAIDSDLVRLGVTNGSSDLADGVLHPDAFPLDSVRSVVVRYDLATARTTLWLDPESEGSDLVSATDETTLRDVLAFAFRQSSGIGKMRIDRLRVGRTWKAATGDGDPVAPLPAVSFTTVGGAVGEGVGEIAVHLERSGDTSEALTVGVETSGSADAVADYETPADTVTFGIGEAEATWTLRVVDDADIEASESVTISLKIGNDYRLGATREISFQIEDNDGSLAPPRLGVPSISSEELRVVIAGDAGQTYFVEASTDLDEWAQIDELQNAAGDVELVYPIPEGQPLRFFRVRMKTD